MTSGNLSVEHIHAVERNKEAFDNRLVLDSEKKELLNALVTVHMGKDTVVFETEFPITCRRDVDVPRRKGESHMWTYREWQDEFVVGVTWGDVFPSWEWF